MAQLPPFCIWFYAQTAIFIYFFIDFRERKEGKERDRGREREGERERHRFVAPLIYLLIGWFWYVLWLGIEPSTLVYGLTFQPTELLGQGLLECSLALCIVLGEDLGSLGVYANSKSETDHLIPVASMCSWSCDLDASCSGTESHSNKPQGALKLSRWFSSVEVYSFQLCTSEGHHCPR